MISKKCKKNPTQPYRRKSHKEHAKALGKLRAELDKATKEFAEFERKDIKHREDLKNMKQRAKKLDEKLAKVGGRGDAHPTHHVNKTASAAFNSSVYISHHLLKTRV